VLEVDLLVFPMLAVPTRPRRGDHDPDLDQGWPDLSNEWAVVEGGEGSGSKKGRGKRMKGKRERHERGQLFISVD
jgi:hypothetical protein